MCVEARYSIQYIHFSFHWFCDNESSRCFATVFNHCPATWLYVAGSGSGVKLLPPVLAAHAGSGSRSNCTNSVFASFSKNFNSMFTIQQYTTTHDFKQIHIFTYLSYYTNNLANNGFATFSKTVIIIHNMSNIEHSLKLYTTHISTTFMQSNLTYITLMSSYLCSIKVASYILSQFDGS